MITFQGAGSCVELRSPELKDTNSYEDNIIWKRSYTGALHNILQSSEKFLTLEFANLSISSQRQLLDFKASVGCSVFKYTDYADNIHNVQFVEKELMVSSGGKKTDEEYSETVTIKLRKI